MKTTFSKKDLVKFGKYLFSDERNERVHNKTNKKQVTHADVENFLKSIEKIE